MSQEEAAALLSKLNDIDFTDVASIGDQLKNIGINMGIEWDLRSKI